MRTENRIVARATLMEPRNDLVRGGLRFRPAILRPAIDIYYYSQCEGISIRFECFNKFHLPLLGFSRLIHQFPLCVIPGSEEASLILPTLH